MKDFHHTRHTHNSHKDSEILLADDGTPLEVKTAEVLDQDGATVYSPQSGGDAMSGGSRNGRSPLSSFVPFIFAASIALLLIAGFAVGAVFIAVLALFLILRMLLGALGLGRPKRRNPFYPTSHK